MIHARRPDIVIIEKQSTNGLIIDIACPNDLNAHEKEQGKILKYQDLRIEMENIWKKRLKAVPVAIGALETMTHKLPFYLTEINQSIDMYQACILGTGIIRKVLQLLGPR